MRHGWDRTLTELAAEYGGTLEDRGHKFAIHLPNGATVFCSKTPSKVAPDRVRRDIRKALTEPRRHAC